MNLRWRREVTLESEGQGVSDWKISGKSVEQLQYCVELAYSWWQVTPLETASPSPPAPISASGTGHTPTRASVFKAGPFQRSLLYNISYSLGSRKPCEDKKPNKQKSTLSGSVGHWCSNLPNPWKHPCSKGTSPPTSCPRWPTWED